MSRTPKEIWCRSGLYYEYVDDWSEGSWSPTNDGGVKYVLADRIEELEAKLAKSVELALEECPFRCGTPNYDNWWRNRRATLAEIKGGKDGN